MIAQKRFERACDNFGKVIQQFQAETNTYQQI